MVSNYTVADVAKRYNVAPRTVLDWVARGQLSGLKLSSKTYRFSAEDLADFEEKQKIKNQPARKERQMSKLKADIIKDSLDKYIDTYRILKSTEEVKNEYKGADPDIIHALYSYLDSAKVSKITDSEKFTATVENWKIQTIEAIEKIASDLINEHKRVVERAEEIVKLPTTKEYCEARI